MTKQRLSFLSCLALGALCCLAATSAQANTPTQQSMFSPSSSITAASVAPDPGGFTQASASSLMDMTMTSTVGRVPQGLQPGASASPPLDLANNSTPAVGALTPILGGRGDQRPSSG